MSIRPEGFLRGALILTGTTLLVRLLSALYNPLVTRLFAPWDGYAGDAGMGLARVPMWTYQILLAFTASGFNIAISKLIAERIAVGDSRAARGLFRGVLWGMGAVGLALGLALWFGAPFLARVFSGDPGTMPGFRAIAPAVPAMTLMAAYRGLFQGAQQMSVAGISQVIEQLVRVACGLALVAWLAPRSVVLGAAGYNFSDVPGALAALLYLWWLHRRLLRQLSGPGLSTAAVSAPVVSAPIRPWVRELVSFALPIALIAAAVPLMMQFDAWLVFARLRAVGVGADAARAAYGQLSNAFTLVFLPTVLSGALYLSLVPAVAESLARHEVAIAHRRIRAAYRVTALLGLPIAAGLWVLADPIYRLVFGGGGGPVLAAMALGTLFLMAQQTASGILQGAGNSITPARNLLLGVGLKVFLTWYLTPHAAFGVRGAALGTAAGFGLAATLNLWSVARRVGIGLDWAGLVWRPGLAAALMAGCLWALQAVWPAAGHPATLALIAAGAGIYAAVLIAVHGVETADLHLVPGVGPAVANWLQRRGLL